MRAADCTFFESRQSFRDWLTAHHDTESVLHVGFYKQATRLPTITYSEAVEEALCFGWIDGVRHTVDDLSYSVRFTPRKPRSNWSAVNLKRVEALIAAGLMRDAGLRAYEQRNTTPTPNSHQGPPQLPDVYLAQFRASDAAWRFFQSQPPWYRRTATLWVISAVKEQTRQRRLAALIADSEAGRPIKPLARPERT